MKFRFLTNDFFNDYIDCVEMERKQNRPYAHICLLEVDGLHFAIPIRHNITHKYAVFTNDEKTQGLDLTKAVIINDFDRYVDNTRVAYINDDEYNILINKKHFIKQKLKTYIGTYKRALINLENSRNKSLCEKSTLQYFHNELNINN